MRSTNSAGRGFDLAGTWSADTGRRSGLFGAEGKLAAESPCFSPRVRELADAHPRSCLLMQVTSLGHTKTTIVVVVRRLPVVAVRGPSVPRVVVPRTATQHTGGYDRSPHNKAAEPLLPI